jgi:hypothetical protein
MILPIKRRARRARRGGNVLSRLFWGWVWSRSDRSEHHRQEEGKMINHQDLGVLGVLGV